MKKYNLTIISLFLILSAYAQVEVPVHWSYGAKKITGSEAVIFIKAKIEDGWHIYSVNQIPGGPTKTSFIFKPSKDYTLMGKLTEPIPHTEHDEVFDIDVSYFEKSVIFQQKIKLKAGQAVVKGSLNYMACSGERCIAPDDVYFSIPVK